MLLPEILDSIILYALVLAVICVIRSVCDMRYWFERLEHRVSEIEKKRRK